MATPQDWYLQPQEEAVSKLHCRHCDAEIGEVRTAGQTPTGRDTGRTQEDVTLDAQQISREHLRHCEKHEPVDREDLEVDSAKRPPENAPLENRRQ